MSDINKVKVILDGETYDLELDEDSPDDVSDLDDLALPDDLGGQLL